MTHPDFGQRAFSPVPIRRLRGMIPPLVTATFAVAGVTLLAVLRPTPWSATWWLVIGVGLAGTLLALLDWHRLTQGVTLPGTLITDLLAIGLLWTEPTPLAGGLILILDSAFIGALFPAGALSIHLGISLVGIIGAIWLGAEAGTVAILAVVILGVTAVLRVLYQAFRELAVQTDHLERLMELLPVLKAQGVEEVVKAAVRHMVKATTSDLGIVLLLDESAKVLRPHYLHSEQPTSPAEEQAMMNVEVPLGIGLTGWVATTGQSLFTGDAAHDPRAFHVPGTQTYDESIMVVPLMTNGKLYGVLRLDRSGVNRYRKDDLQLLELMAAHVSDALSRAQMEERMSRRDALTGVYNRHFLNEWCARTEPDETEISLLMIDCRGFKQINDRWGHLQGDRVLQECARIITQSVRSRDLVFRYGGDEFLVVLENTGTEDARVIATRLREAVEEWNSQQEPGSPILGIDIGVETAEGSSWQSLLGQADVMMYAAKRSC